ncbi:hypothetical protein EVJ24_10940 [Exiguobacterium sp. SH1S21]|uniref:hypothetical protein n=1 Tax=Exiguobacterium sp. SH1S21 TaxID=2510953 RepID=UPI00103B0D8B|nr:hypothetical protein [Exiguobacterium sp. SH1S21]TCI53033.1 hypothetical protein EVJ24_10940 [Exiguobacterium sp. SH1S21]
MKLAVLISAALHILYFVGTFGVGFIRTVTYEPDIIAQADSVVVLQNEVVIGTTGSPLIYVLTWIGLTIVLALGLLAAQRMRRTR